MSARRVETFNPESPKEPNFYVDKLIKIVRGMAPNANRYQWNRFAITARNIEHSHEFYVLSASDSSTSSPSTENQTKVPYEKMSTDDLKDLFFKYERDAEDLAARRDELEAERVKKDKETVVMYQVLAKRSLEEMTSRRQNEKD